MTLFFSIIDDKDSDIEVLSRLMREWEEQSDTKIELSCFNHADDFYCGIENGTLQCHAAFIDIQMPDGCGMDLARKLSMRYPDILKVFYSSLIEYTCKGFTVNAIRYLLKTACDLDDQALECFNCIKGLAEDSISEYVIGTGVSSIRIKHKNIVYVESGGNYCIIHTRDSEYRERKTFKSLRLELPKYFVQCSRTAIVNCRLIRTVKSSQVIMTDSTAINVSGPCKETLMRSLQEIQE